MPSPPIDFLPKLKKGTQDRLSTAKAPGVWNDEQGQGRLGILAESIEDQSRNLDVRSIPDPWARAILFTRSLYHGEHRLHQQTLGEWRGLLALIGLKEIRGYTELSSQPISLKDLTEGGSFLATLARIKPVASGSFAEGGSWEQFHLLRWSGAASGRLPRVFGLTSPTTLVATGAFYQDVFQPDEVPWFVNGRLTDPTETDGALSLQERAALAEWLRAVRAILRDLTPGRWLARLLELLQEYAADLSDEIAVPENVFSDYGLGLKVPEIFGAIDKPRRRRAATLTELRIVTTSPASQRKVYILFDPTLPVQLARKDREIYFYETETLASAPRIYPVAETRSGSLRNNAFGEVSWCNQGFFFQDDLIYDQVESLPGDLSGGTDTFPGCRPVQTFGPSENRHIVLPLTEDAARLFSPDYLEQNFTIEWLHGGGARCRLRVEVTELVNSRPGQPLDLAVGPDQRKDWITLEHVYAERDMNRVTGEIMPLICIWPNFQFADEPTNDRLQLPGKSFRNRWKRYYLFEAWPGVREAKELEVAPLDLPSAERREVRQQNGILQLVTPMQRFPDVLVCKMPFTGKKPRRNDTEPPRGLMLLRRPEQVAITHGTDALLGIDFGTTGTSIYSAVTSGGKLEDPREMAFASRIFQVSARAQHEVKDLTRHHFIPSASNPSGRMLSVFQVKGTEGGSAELIDGHVLFPSAEADPNTLSPFVWGEPASIVINLKWGGTPRESDAAGAFLKQLCLQSLAELAANGIEAVEVRYSYPTAYSSTDREKFSKQWDGTLEEIRTATSMGLTLDPKNDRNYEAVAATRFFARPGPNRLNINSGAITLDIGGGTTDIAFWGLVNDVPSLADHTSVLFAGTEMFQAALRKNLSVLKDIDRNFPLPTLDESKYRLAYYAELDALIATHANTVLSRLPFVVDASPQVGQFIHILELGMCGIAFYTGLLYANLIAKKKMDLEDTRTIQIYIGGNASRLLHWCDLGEFKEGSFFYQTFCDTFRAGVQIGAPDALSAKAIRINLSGKYAKHEVAYGLVSASTQPLWESEPSQPAGEAFSAADGPHAWNETPDLATPTERRVRVNSKLPIFMQFLNSVNEEIGLDERDMIANAVSEALDRMTENLPARAAIPQSKTMRDRVSAKNHNPVRNQPLFIMLLKQLIDLRIASLQQP